jgi:uncharacterized protein (TIGR03435 family)
MTRAIATAGLIVVLAHVAFAQPAATQPAFEAASIALNKSGGFRGGVRTDPERLTAANATLKQIILYAYDLRTYQVSGPDWIESERYDVAAKAESAASTAQMRLMLQTLLAERFKLKTHRETKDMPVYWLIVAKNGPKLRDVKDAEALMQNGSPPPLRAGVNAMFMTVELPQFADVLSRSVGRPVLDKTGIAGRYFFQFEWTLDPSQSGGVAAAGARDLAPDADPSLFTALQDKLIAAVGNRDAGHRPAGENPNGELAHECLHPMLSCRHEEAGRSHSIHDPWHPSRGRPRAPPKGCTT